MILTPHCDILITFTKKHLRQYYTSAVSGHLFELFDYYLHLRNFCKCKMWIPEDFDKPKLLSLLKSRYSAEFNEDDLIAGYDYKLIKAPIILCVDNCYHFIKEHRKSYLCDKFFTFACGDAYFETGAEPPNIITLADSAVYDFSKFNCEVIEYAKKVNPQIKKSPGTKPFAHITKNCKSISSNLLSELLLKYPDIIIYSDYLPQNDNIIREPIFDFSFGKFVYTPIQRHFDCSNRLITECALLGIGVDYFCIDYIDRGLEPRKNNPLGYVLQNDDLIYGILTK